MDAYDEFGNYIGPELGSSSEEEGEEVIVQREAAHLEEVSEDDNYESHHNSLIAGDDAMAVVTVADEGRVVLHEDKKYYPEAEEVYPGVRTVVLDEDAQDLSEPLIRAVETKNFSVLMDTPPTLTAADDFVAFLANQPHCVRSVAVVGHIHHGKTSLLDILFQSALADPWASEESSQETSRGGAVKTSLTKFTDTRKDEQDREMSIKSALMTVAVEDMRGRQVLLNLLDTPGHADFGDEWVAAIRAVDNVLLVVDAVEGVMLQTERTIKAAMAARVPLTMVINKMDRLVLELKLPPSDAYFKLCHTIDEVNGLIRKYAPPGVDLAKLRLSPARGNVCFASALHQWVFSLESFAESYVQDVDPSCGVAASDLAPRLWGDWYAVGDDRLVLTTHKEAAGPRATRTFIQFVLEPLYKLYSATIGENPEVLKDVLLSVGVHLKHAELHLDPHPLLKLVMRRFFGLPTGLVSMLNNNMQSPVARAPVVAEHFFNATMNSTVRNAVTACDSHAPFVAHVTKLFNTPDGSRFWALARIYSGVVSVGDRIRVLGEAFTQEDDEDMAIREVTGVSLAVGRFNIEINTAKAGSLVLLAGIDGPIKKTATLCGTDVSVDDLATFVPLQFDQDAVVRLSVEPLNPSELPKMVDGLRRINKAYPLSRTKVEESGEHVIFGTGEMYLDCVMHDLRLLFSSIEIKVADPVVSFNETVIDSSALNCFTESANGRNKLTMLAEPLETALCADISAGKIKLGGDLKSVSQFFTEKHGWDLLSSRSVWAFGPDDVSPNLLLNNTLPSEVSPALLGSVRDSFVQGFKWATREGPLCDEPIRNVKFRILDATLASEPIHRGGGQIIPTSRRSVYASFLTATPRLMEPVNLVEIQAPADCVQAVYPVLQRRRGHVIHEEPKPGAPFYVMKAFLPVMDSFGFETDLRAFTMGQVFSSQVFDHWSVVTGDPLDKNIILHPLEPSPPLALARDFMVKTRRRKGLNEEVSVHKYLDESMLRELARYEAESA